jgi:cytosine/adenosine deaminase-related metal-dependent hydrolase
MTKNEVPSCDCRIDARYLITMADGDEDLKERCSILIRGDVITAVMPTEMLEGAPPPPRHYRLDDHLVMPGMINTHGHAPMVCYCGRMPGGRPFMEVLFTYMLPMERNFLLRDNLVYLSSVAGACEYLKGGVTTSAEMYYEIRQTARAFEEVGMRGILGETVLSEVPSPTARTPDEAIAYLEGAIADLRNSRFVTPAVAPHTYYTVNDPYLMECSRCAETHHVPLLIHLNETPGETAPPGPSGETAPDSFYHTRKGVSSAPLEHLQGLGFFDHPNITAAHCVYLTEGEKEILVRHKVGVAYNPVCNTQIGLAVAPAVQLSRMGAAVGIATDGPMTNDRLDLLGQLTPALCMQRSAAGDSTALTEYGAVRMVTIDAARALHMEDSVGSIEAGKKADLVGIDYRLFERGPQYLKNGEPYVFLCKIADRSGVSFVMTGGGIPDLDAAGRTAPLLDEHLKEIARWRPS